VAVRDEQVLVLDGHGGGQHDVGVARGIGQEVLDHHGEEVLARQAAQHSGLVRDAGRGVARIDEQSLDPGVTHLE
jgi:hypothetical protein